MPAKVRWTPEALQDLDDIWLHIAVDSLRGANKVLDRIDEAELRLSEHPFSGVARDDLRSGMRLLPVGSYVILHTSAPGLVTIVRVLWGGRDLPALL